MKILYHIKKDDNTYLCVMEGRSEDGSKPEVTLDKKTFTKYKKQQNLINLKSKNHE